jgi:MOSC domain-containing protein YiiM
LQLVSDADLDQSLAERLARLPRSGRVEWIGLRRAHRGTLDVVDAALALPDRGLQGDRASERRGRKRQVSLIQAEHLPVLAALCALEQVDPAWLRRNLVVSGINLLALRDRRFRIGKVLLEGSGTCPPCARMEEALGSGGYNAMRGHGGITARVLEGGSIGIGDAVSAAAPGSTGA